MKIDDFIDGLEIVRKDVIAAGFYNSSETANFCLSRKLTSDEQDKLAKYGFTYDSRGWYGVESSISFEGWYNNE